MRERFRFDASVFAVVRRDGRYLGVRRSGTGWLDGYWSLPAGAHDGGESFLQSAVRELKEETGLVVQGGKAELLHVQHVFTEKGEWAAFYFGMDGSGEAALQEPDKHDRVEWVDFSTLEEPVVPYVQQALARIAEGDVFSVFRVS